MVKKILRSTLLHDHWFAEWWSAVLLTVAGLYGFVIQHPYDGSQTTIQDSLHIFSFETWKFIFSSAGLLQFTVLYSGSLIGRGVAAFISASILLWVFLNVVIYDYWHISFLALGCFVAINLWALKRIFTGIERKYVGTHKMVVGDKP